MRDMRYIHPPRRALQMYRKALLVIHTDKLPETATPYVRRAQPYMRARCPPRRTSACRYRAPRAPRAVAATRSAACD